MISCDRQTFINLSMGMLLDRTADRKVRIGDTQEAHEAMAAHDRGEVVRLTYGKDRWSYIYKGEETLSEPKL